MGKYFATVNIGSTNVTAVSVRWNRSGDYAIEKFSRVPSRGFLRGAVSDSGAATDTIGEVIGRLDTKGIRDVYAGISSSSLGLTKGIGTVLVSKYGREISRFDIKRCIKMASIVKMPIEKEPIHRIVAGFAVDGEDGIHDPFNLEGIKLDAHVNVVTVNSSVIRNMQRVIADSGSVPAGFIFSGLASAYRILSEEDMQKGAIFLAIRRDLQETLVFNDGILCGVRVSHGGTEEMMSGEAGVQEEALRTLYSDTKSLEGWDKVRKIVVFFEDAMTEEFIDAAENVFKLPVKIGNCSVRPFEKLPQDRVGYVGSLGMLDYLYSERLKDRRNTDLFKGAADKIINFIDSYF
ncbi:MAG: cell division protein FtsA [Candidatus Omnitrophota bacterium]